MLPGPGFEPRTPDLEVAVSIHSEVNFFSILHILPILWLLVENWVYGPHKVPSKLSDDPSPYRKFHFLPYYMHIFSHIIYWLFFQVNVQEICSCTRDCRWQYLVRYGKLYIHPVQRLCHCTGTFLSRKCPLWVLTLVWILELKLVFCMFKVVMYILPFKSS